MGGLLAGWLNVLVAIVLPFAFLVYLAVKRRGGVTPFIVGIATFCVAEILVVVPLFQKLATLPFMAAHQVLYIVLLAFCAAAAEGLARWVAFRYILRGKHGFMDGVALGVGHSYVAVALPAVGYLISALYVPALLEETGFAPIALDSLESLFTLAMQLAVTLLILRSVRDSRPAFLLLGMGVHMAYRAVTALRYIGFGSLGQRAVLAIIAAAALFFVLKNRKAYGLGQEAPARPKAAVEIPDPGSLDENIWK